MNRAWGHVLLRTATLSGGTWGKMLAGGRKPGGRETLQVPQASPLLCQDSCCHLQALVRMENEAAWNSCLPCMTLRMCSWMGKREQKSALLRAQSDQEQWPQTALSSKPHPTLHLQNRFLTRGSWMAAEAFPTLVL